MSDQEWQPRIRRIDADGRERLQYIRSLMRDQQIDAARDELLSMLQENDKSVPARLMLGSLYQSQNLLGDALDQYKYAIAVDPMHVQAHLRAGTCCLQMNDVEQARSLISTVLDLDPKQVQARVAMAQVLAKTGQMEEAIVQLEDALRLDPQMAQARMLMAQILNQTGHTAEAIRELSGFVNANPDHSRAAGRLAQLELQQGNTAKAIELLETAVKSEPDSAFIWGMIGRLKLREKDYEGAERAFGEVIRIRPKNPRSSLMLVSALVPQGKLDKARELLKQVPRRGRLGGVVHQQYGDIYAKQKMFEEAAQSYRAALLNSEGGEAVLDEIASSSPQGADGAQLVARLQAAIAKHRAEARQRFAEERPRTQNRPPIRRRMNRAQSQRAR